MSTVRLSIPLAVLIFLFYGNTLSNDFVFDDVWLIRDNQLIKEIKNLPLVLVDCVKAQASTSCQETGVYYRPLLNLSFILTYQLNSNPYFFHFANLVYFFVTAILVLALFILLFKDKILALIGTILFAINPINSFVVNVSSGINETQQAIFFLIMFITYIKFSQKKKIKYLLISTFSYFLCLLSKEGSVFLVIVPIIFGIIYGKSGLKEEIKNHLKNSLIFLIPLFFYILIRQLILGGVAHKLLGYHDMNTLTSLLTSITIFPIYLIKLIFPFPLNPQDDFLPITELNYKVLLAFVGWLFFAAAGAVAYKKNYKRTFLGISIIFLSLLPVVLFVNKVGRFILADNRLFIASIAFALIIVELSRKIRAKKILLLIFVLYFLGSFWVVFNRNKDFKDEFSLNKKISSLSPNNFGAHYNLGVNYSERGELDLAIESYKKVLAINPEFWQAHNNLANAYLNKGLIDQAINEFRQVTLLNPDLKSRKAALNNLLLLKSGTESAKLSLEAGDIRYKDDTGLSFKYPIFFRLEERKDSIALYQEDLPFVIEISLKNTYLQDFESYIESQDKTYGKLVNQGLASIPNFQKAYVKIWDLAPDGTGQKLEFFLFNGGKVVNILVYPANSELMVEFDKLIGSIKIE